MPALSRSTEDNTLDGTISLLGGQKTLGRPVTDDYQAHDLIVAGLPVRAALQLISSLDVLPTDPSWPRPLGASRTTVARWKNAPAASRLSRTHSARTWVLAATLIRAARVLGSQRDAERWLMAHIPALDHRRPVDLLTTPMGVKLVLDHVRRLELGVYT